MLPCTVAHVVQLLPLFMPVFCDAMCRTVACTVYATVLCVAVQLYTVALLCMPQCYVLMHAVQSLHVVQSLPFCVLVFCVAMCCTVSHVLQLLPLCMP